MFIMMNVSCKGETDQFCHCLLIRNKVKIYMVCLLESLHRLSGCIAKCSFALLDSLRTRGHISVALPSYGLPLNFYFASVLGLGFRYIIVYIVFCQKTFLAVQSANRGSS